VSTDEAADALRRDAESRQAPLLLDLENAEREQNWKRVEGLCKQILQEDSENWGIWQRLALSLESRNDLRQAETLWRHLTQRFAQRPEPYLALAALQRKLGAPDAARAVLQQAERRLGQRSELSQSLRVIDDPWAEQSAVPQLNDGATASDVALVLQQAQGHLAAGRHAEAEACFEQLISARPTALRFQLSLAQLKQRRGDHEAVIEQLLPLFSGSPVNGELLQGLQLPMVLLQALLEQQRWSELEQQLGPLLSVAPSDGRLLYLKARCSLERGNDPDALPLLQQALQHSPKLLPALIALGQLLARLGDWDSAIPQLERALAIDPNATEAAEALDRARREQLWQRGETALSRADWASAQRFFRALLEFNGESRALDRLELLASLEPEALGQPELAETGAFGRAGQRLEQFSRMLDRLEAVLQQH